MVKLKKLDTRFEPVPYVAEDDPLVSPQAAEHLARSMNVLREGKPPTPSFPLGDKEPEEVLREWMAILDADDSLPDWMKEYERSRLEKTGPQGGIVPWTELRELFKLYYENNTLVQVENTIFQRANAYVTTAMGRIKLRPMSLVNALERSISRGTLLDRAAAWPDFDLKKDDVEAQNRALLLASNGQWRDGKGYVFERFQKQKPRAFMPMPFSLMILQARWYNPWMQWVQGNISTHPLAALYASKLGFDAVLDHLNHTPVQAVGRRFYVQGDFAKMDTHNGKAQFEAVVIPQYVAQYGADQEMIDAIRATYAMPIITPDGLSNKPHGTASGATMTNDSECRVNTVHQEMVVNLLQSRMRCVVVHRQIDGDDSSFELIVQDDTLTDEQVIQMVKDAYNEAAIILGLEAQVEKLLVSRKHGIYLQRMVYVDDTDHKYHGAYPTILALNSILNPESYLPERLYDPDYWELSIIEKLENCKDHPKFYEFIDFVVTRLRTAKQFAPGNIGWFKSILSKWERYTRARRNISSSYTSTMSNMEVAGNVGSIFFFRTVKYLVQKYF